MTDISRAARRLLDTWLDNTRIPGLEGDLRPHGRDEGYAIAAELAEIMGDRVAGWKIAATSLAGQRHINVDGPLAGRIFAGKLTSPGGAMALGDNIMNVAEAEFAFRFAIDLPPRSEPYERSEVMAAVGALHLSIEVPDSRYLDFTKVGAAQLIADTACAHLLMLSPPVTADWRSLDLAGHGVTAYRNGEEAGRGHGAAALGDPCVALTWLVNEAANYCGGIVADQFVTTGTCIVPVAIKPGDRLDMDYGSLGRLAALIT
jgi:2-keto-4-pentenoate hydratase